MSLFEYDVFYRDCVDEQMDLHSLRLPKHDYDVHSLHMHDVRPVDLPACWHFSTQGGQCIENDPFIAHFLWICRFYKSVPSNKHCWNLPTSKNNDNTLYNIYPALLLRANFFYKN